MNLIAAADRNWAIGLKNKLLVQIPADQRYFRQMTEGHVIVMGRKTLESFPGGRPLPNRINIVLSSNKGYKPGGCIVFHDLEELKEGLKEYAPEEIFVIGGGRVYSELIGLCDTAYITKIDKAFDADTYFPNLDEMPEWELVRDGKEAEEQTYFDLIYYFQTYRRRV